MYKAQTEHTFAGAEPILLRCLPRASSLTSRTLIQTLLVPPLVALVVCIHLGYAFSSVMLPLELRPYRWLVMPLVGCTLLLLVTAALTTLTPLKPLQIAIGTAVLAVT